MPIFQSCRLRTDILLHHTKSNFHITETHFITDPLHRAHEFEEKELIMPESSTV